MTEENATSKILLFGKWDTSEVVVKDQGLIRYITVSSTEIPSGTSNLDNEA